MKRFISVFLILALVTFTLPAISANAEGILRSSVHFNKTSVGFNASGSATFVAVLTMKCSNVGISSCTLQQQNGSRWVFASNLDTPAGATDTAWYSAEMDYSSSMKSGNTYRLSVTFTADGESITMTSASVTY